MILTKEAQTRLILRHMEAGEEITGMEAYELYNCMRLPARIADLKKSGVSINSCFDYELDERGKVVKKWKKYWIAQRQ